MSYNLNPCKACWEKYKNGQCNINTVNSCVTETAAAFAGIPSNNFIVGTEADNNWSSCMDKMMKAEGRSKCDFQLHMAPVFNQAPHYFPTLFSESGNPDQSEKTCIQNCSELRFNKKTCIENCKTDRKAVVLSKKALFGIPLARSRSEKSVIVYLATALALIFLLSIIYIWKKRV
jgi:hypothetical protein